MMFAGKGLGSLQREGGISFLSQGYPHLMRLMLGLSQLVWLTQMIHQKEA
jgi:hypothetical protein